MIFAHARFIATTYIAQYRHYLHAKYTRLTLFLIHTMEPNNPKTPKRESSMPPPIITSRCSSGASLHVPRTRAPNGLLELKANATKPPQSPGIQKPTHRRTQSLKIPLLIKPFRPDFIFPATAQETATKEAHLASVEAQLEYLHRNIFLGTASLDDFLEALETCDYSADTSDMWNENGNGNGNGKSPMTTREKIVKAFSILADREQLLARKHSIHAQPRTPSSAFSGENTDNYSLIRRVDPTNPNTSFLAHSQIKLGAVSLGEFWGYLGPGNSARGTDEEEKVPVLAIVRAFELACQRDIEVGERSGSRARAFRRWMVGREDIVKGGWDEVC